MKINMTQKSLQICTVCSLLNYNWRRELALWVANWGGNESREFIFGNHNSCTCSAWTSTGNESDNHNPKL